MEVVFWGTWVPDWPGLTLDGGYPGLDLGPSAVIMPQFSIQLKLYIIWSMEQSVDYL